MKTTRFLLLGLSLLLLSQCWWKKDDPAPPTTIALPQGLKELALFRNGTYWVYRNEQTGELDSVSVSGFEHDTMDVEKPSPPHKLWYRQENFRYVTTSSLTGQRLQYHGLMHCSLGAYDPNDACHVVNRRLVQPGISEGVSADYLLYRPVVGARTSSPYSGSVDSETTVVETLPTLTVQGQQYRDVVHMHVSNNPTELPWGSHSDYYIAPGAGLVRRETNQGNPAVRWDLVRKHIVQ